MSLKIALVGNPNSGKTTLFNAMTGMNQYVGNRPGVTIDKKEGQLRGYPDVTVTDLPGIYSLSPYSPEEVIAREYITNDSPDVILNIVDGTNLERNLYLTTQLTELGIPMVLAINMVDILRKQGDVLQIQELSSRFGCPVLEISALRGTGIKEVAAATVDAAEKKQAPIFPTYSPRIEGVLAYIKRTAAPSSAQQRWFTVKLFERDADVHTRLQLPARSLAAIDSVVRQEERVCDDDAEAIITDERYRFVTALTASCLHRKSRDRLSLSDKIDRIVTHRILALPIFAAVMWLIYYISIGSVGALTVSFTNDTLFGEWIPPLVTDALLSIGCADWLISLIVDGIIGGVGAVLGFVPQMLILFLLLALLEDCGYMARVAFIMDRIFRKLGLSGKSFIPMLVATGCAVPGIMASRTIESVRDRRMTVMTTGFIPCSAKMPIVGLIAGALFGGSAWIAVAAYFVGIAAVVMSGIILKKTKPFAGEAAPFVMELPAYHAPMARNILRTTGEHGLSFIKRAGTVIFAASVVIWVMNSLSFEGGIHYITEEHAGASLLEILGSGIAWIFAPLGFGRWEAAVATILGLVAKEEVVGVFGSLSSMADADLALEFAGSSSEALSAIGLEFFGGNALAGFSFLIFNLLCAPCFAAMGAIRREMNDARWTAAAIGYMSVFAYGISLIVYQLGSWFVGSGNIIGAIAAAIVLLALLYALFRKNPYTAKEFS